MKHLYTWFCKICYVATLNVTSSAMAQQDYLDISFGTNGIVTTEKFEPHKICVQQDGKILVGGSIQTGGIDWDCIIYRFNSDGTLDTGFGTDGISHIVSNHNNTLAGIAQLPNGDIVILAKNTYRTSIYSTFIRLHQDGSLNTLYGGGGILTIMPWVLPYKMILSDDGKILVAGEFRRLASSPPFNTWSSRPTIKKYNDDLTVDTSFLQPSYPLTMMAGARDVDIGADGSVVAIFRYGFSNNNITYKIAKFLSTGEPRTDFGVDGIKDIETSSGSHTLNDFQILDNGKFLITGTNVENSQNALLMRMSTGGNLDSTFASYGIFTLENSSGQDESAIGSIVLNNGKIVTALQKWNTDNHDFGLLFSDANGSPDYSLADNGLHVTPLLGNQILTCITQQPDGKILVAGFEENAMLLMRYDISAMLNSDNFSFPSIQVHPNPTIDKITISSLQDNVNISLHNVSGQKLMEVVSKGETTLDLSALTPGIYFINTLYRTCKIIRK